MLPSVFHLILQTIRYKIFNFVFISFAKNQIYSIALSGIRLRTVAFVDVFLRVVENSAFGSII